MLQSTAINVDTFDGTWLVMVLLKIAIMALMAIGKRIIITAMVCEEGAADVGPNYPRGQGLKSSYRLCWVGENETRSSWWSKFCMTLPQWVMQLLQPLSRMGDRCLPPAPPAAMLAHRWRGRPGDAEFFPFARPLTTLKRGVRGVLPLTLFTNVASPRRSS